MARKRIAATEEGSVGIGERLTLFRKARGITQVELADRLGTTQALVSKYEKGDLLLHGELILKLAQLLRVSTDELLGAPRQLKGGAPLPVIKDRRLVRRIEKFDRLPRRDKEALMRTIDAFLIKSEPERKSA